MKCGIILLACVPLLVFAKPDEKSYIASTPAGVIVRTFLGISLTDSVDFIRWKLTLQDSHYSLQCNYGIAKPNTNGFISGGKSVSLEGELKKEKDNYKLYYHGRVINLVELNANLLHLLDENNRLLIGNGGWSYTLNITMPVADNRFSLSAKQMDIVDSIVFEGRTPCGIPSLFPAGKECYKLKWRISLYAPQNGAAPQYWLWGSLTYKDGGKRGTWKTVTTTNNRMLYCLNDSDGQPFIYLLKADQDILLFTDTNGKPLVGNEDFSYTLNKMKPRRVTM